MAPHPLTPAQVAKLLADDKANQPKTPDNKCIILQTSKPIGTVTYFTSEGDDTTDPTSVGGGTKMEMVHNISDPIDQTIDIEYNFKENPSYIHEGYIIWQNASFDQVSLSVVPETTSYTVGSGTNYNLYGGYLIIPAAGDGTTTVASEDIELVEMPVNLSTGVRPPAFWNADYDTGTHTFSNITPAPTGDGVYNMYGVAVTLSRMVNKVLLLDSGWLMLQTSDSMALGHNMKVQLGLHTQGDDHNWKAACILTFHRTKTS